MEVAPVLFQESILDLHRNYQLRPVSAPQNPVGWHEGAASELASLSFNRSHLCLKLLAGGDFLATLGEAILETEAILRSGAPSPPLVSTGDESAAVDGRPLYFSDPRGRGSKFARSRAARNHVLFI